MAYKSIDARTKTPTNREQRRKIMKRLGLLKGATRKRTASLKVVRNG